MASEHDSHRTTDPKPDGESPQASVEDVLEEHLSIYPGEAAAIGHEGHEPSEHSFWPVIVAATVLIIGIGFLTNIAISAVGAVLLLVALVGWFTEPWVS